MKTSLGLLEVAGLALAVKAADIMAKAAGVEITGIERTNGSGWMLVSVTGDVASVNAAITGGAALARLEHGWVADRVIARPAAALDSWITARGASTAATAPEQAASDVEPAEAGTNEDAGISEPVAISLGNAAAEAAPVLPDETDAAEPGPAASCNLCHDPACTRSKGEPRGACIHYAERGNV